MAGEDIGPEVLERWALAYLGRYASSAENLRRVLLRRARRRSPAGAEAIRRAAPLVAELVERYRGAGLLDDKNYAEQQAQSLSRHGAPLAAIRARLIAKGVDGAVAGEALAVLRDERSDPDLAAACVFARRRRLGPYRSGSADRARELAAFARAGFSRQVAEQVLACADRDALEALTRPDPE